MFYAKNSTPFPALIQCRQDTETLQSHPPCSLGELEIANFGFFSKGASVKAICFVPVCISTYGMEQKKSLIMALKLELSISARAHTQLSKLHLTRTHLKVPDRGNS